MAVKVYFDCGLLGYDLKMEVAHSFETKHPEHYMVPQTQKTTYSLNNGYHSTDCYYQLTAYFFG
jgi:hypothetical protein